MPELVDSHFHIWRKADLPWLSGPMQPRIFGPYEPIRRDYPIAEFRADAEPHGVGRAIYVQANWPPARALDEVRWVQSVADETGWPHAIVGYADLLADDVAPALDASIAASPLLRGVRMQLHWHDNELYRFATRPDLCDDARLRTNLAQLAPRRLLFELQVFPPQMEGAVRLVRALPELQFVLIHAGMLEDATPAGIERWRDGMDALAACANVAVKLSGLGTFLRRLDPDFIAFVADETLSRFGAERCMFGSNFPIEKLWTDYGSLVAAHRAALSKLSNAAQEAVLSGTARRIYRLS